MRLPLDNPKNEVKFHAAVSLLWLLMIPPSALFFAESLPYVVAVSVWANLYTGVSSLQAAKAELELQKRLKRIERKLDGKA